MKVITIKQPWASLIAAGYKEFEFRSWLTKYRGLLLIHAGVGVDKDYLKMFEHLNLDYPKGKIIASAMLDDCILIDKKFNKELSQNSIYKSNDRTGLYAWKLSNVKQIKSDKNIKGQLGLWNIENL